MAFTKWTDYREELENGESYSKRVTGSRHITMSALIEKDGALRAFPPKASEKAFPVFCTLDATAGGKFFETLEGIYPQKGWEFSCEMHHGRAKLAKIFFGEYEKVREKQRKAVEREVALRDFCEQIITDMHAEVEFFVEGDDEVSREIREGALVGDRYQHIAIVQYYGEEIVCHPQPLWERIEEDVTYEFFRLNDDRIFAVKSVNEMAPVEGRNYTAYKLAKMTIQFSPLNLAEKEKLVELEVRPLAP